MRRIVLAVLSFSILACESDEKSKLSVPSDAAHQAITTYKQVVLANYEAVLGEARKLETAVAAFVAAPSQATHDAAKQAWIAARLPYGPSEAFRFYDGPIDNPEDGPEGQLNGWPLDENYIDYTRDAPSAGIINDLTNFPVISAEVIANANEKQGEKALSTGYHAIEFLLWGQDDATPGTGAGKRPFTDYVVGGTAQNQERRKTYLTVATQLLVADLEKVTAAWRPGSDNFAAHFGVNDGTVKGDAFADAIGKILSSLGSMAKAELSGERMTVAYINRTQEDEHSCFSDNTAVDLHGNAVGLQNVWLGRYGTIQGVSIATLVGSVAPELASETSADLASSVDKLNALVTLQNAGKPFDVLIAAPDGSPERTAVLDAIQSLKKVSDDIERAAKALGLSVEFEEPSQTI